MPDQIATCMRSSHATPSCMLRLTRGVSESAVYIILMRCVMECEQFKNSCHRRILNSAVAHCRAVLTCQGLLLMPAMFSFSAAANLWDLKHALQ